MFKLLFIRLWPIWVPILLYFIWLAYVRRRAKKRDEPLPRLKDGPWLWTVMATLLIAIVMFLWMGLDRNPQDGHYIPAQNRDGVLVPGKLIPERAE